MEFVFRPLFFLNCMPYLSNKTLKMIINRIIKLFIVSILKLHLLSKLTLRIQEQVMEILYKPQSFELRPHSLCIPLGAGGGLQANKGGLSRFLTRGKGDAIFSPLKEKAFVIFFKFDINLS